jgi:hypothetical protein
VACKTVVEKFAFRSISIGTSVLAHRHRTELEQNRTENNRRKCNRMEYKKRLAQKQTSSEKKRRVYIRIEQNITKLSI